MYSRFIISRPVLAGVISILIIIAGLVAMQSLPLALYPDITPPTVTVSTVYPGANTQTLAETVATPIEEQVNGVDGMIYMSSTCSSDGSYNLTVTFEVGTDLDMAQVLVQNRVSLAQPKLPEEVRRQGLTVLKKSTLFVQIINLYSPDNRFSSLYLNNYATLYLKDALGRIPGVASVDIVGGSDYGMRIWLDPQRLSYLNLTTDDITNAIQQQNIQVAAGTLGQPPVPADQDFQYTLTVLGRLERPEQFRDIIIKIGPDGTYTRLKDVARIELGAQTYSSYSQYNGKPCATMMLYQLADANALNISTQGKQIMEEFSNNFPEGLKYKITYDVAWFINASIREIVITLFQAVGLVVLVTFVFLEDWRACLIPTMTIPVSLIGTFIFMAAMGFSINTFTLFGLVLAIGIVVDDSIVVVENTQRKIDGGTFPSTREAAIAAMNEVFGPCIATTLVLLSVFVPTAFMSGITGQLYKQFALTISAATVFSTINAITLSPAMCGLLLRESRKDKKKNIFFRGFDKVYSAVEHRYGQAVGRMVHMGIFFVLLFGGFAALTGLGFMKLPTGFLPSEDQGYFMVNVQLPDAAALPRTTKVLDRVTKFYEKLPGVANVITVGGYSILQGATASNYGTVIIVLKPWDERTTPQTSVPGLVGASMQEFAKIQEAVVIPFTPPAIPGLGQSGGFQIMLEDRQGGNLDNLQAITQSYLRDANNDPAITGGFCPFRANVPQMFININRTKVMTQGIQLSTVFDTLQSYLGSSYINDFNTFGRTWQVQIQASSEFRRRIPDLAQLKVRNAKGEMIPMTALCDVEEVTGPQVINRYNMYPAASVTGQAAEGYSSGQAMAVLEKLAGNLPKSMGTEWTGLSYQEVVAGQGVWLTYTLCGVFVFLLLAGLYESFLLPISVVLSALFGILGAIAGTMIAGLDNNTYTQIGIVLLIGLASKSSILIVEFAKVQHEEEGLDRFAAATTASTLRFRAILMTAFADIFGWTPLLLAAGAGAASRHALGFAVVFGMLVATVFGVFFVPVFYALIQKLADKLSGWQPPPKKE